jgi:PucR C-terminal helix-turn-helix domain/GGDEF-like domain
MSTVIHSVELHEDLERLALAGEGWTVLLRRLAAATGRPTRLIGVHGGVLATSRDGDGPALSRPASGVPAPAGTDGGLDGAALATAANADAPVSVITTDGTWVRALAIRAGSRRVGVLAVEEPLGPDGDELLGAACVPLAIEAVRRDAQATARASDAGAIVEELRFGSVRPTFKLARAAARFGIDIDQPHAAAVFTYDGPHLRTWETALTWIEMPVRRDGRRGWTVLAGDIAAERARIRTRLAGMVGDGRVRAVTGSPVVGLTELVRSFREAEVVLALAGRGDALDVGVESLGVSGLLLSLPRARLREYVQRELGALADRPELLATLGAWLDTGGSRVATAERLGIHRNSVGYRMDRIRSRLGDPVASPASCMALHVALAALDVLRAHQESDHG